MMGRDDPFVLLQQLLLSLFLFLLSLSLLYLWRKDFFLVTVVMISVLPVFFFLVLESIQAGSFMQQDTVAEEIFERMECMHQKYSSRILQGRICLMMDDV
jgi:hypothetical protein